MGKLMTSTPIGDMLECNRPWNAPTSDDIPSSSLNANIDSEWMTSATHEAQSLQCSASDLRLCLGLQPSTNPAVEPSSSEHSLLSTLLLPDLEYKFSSVHNFPSLTSGAYSELLDNCYRTSSDVDCSNGLEGHFNPDFALASSYRNIDNRPYNNNLLTSSLPPQPTKTESMDVGTFMHHSQYRDWNRMTSVSSETNGDIDLSDISLRFSPIKSLPSDSFPVYTSSMEDGSSLSSSSEELKKITKGKTGAAIARNNYYLAFENTDTSLSASTSKRAFHPTEQNALSDSGTVSTTRAVISRQLSQESPSGNKMKCWTDVEDYDGEEGENDAAKTQSIIASLHSKENKTRSSSMPKLSSNQVDQNNSGNVTSGYSSSSSATNYRPQLLKPTHRVKQSPSLPLNIERQTTLPTSISATSASRTTHFIPRDRYSAPDLKFLAQQQPHPVKQSTSIRHQRSSLSCPDNLNNATAPIRINNVEDWNSLQILLPKAFRNVLDKSDKQTQNRSGKNSTRKSNSLQCIPSLPTSMLEEENVCPTCYKLQRGFSARDAPANMITSACDCSTPSSSVSSDHNTSSRSAELNFPSPPEIPVRTVFPSLSSIYGRKDSSHSPRHPSPSTNLMEFSRQPAQLVINLNQKQELVTLVKAAAMGVVGYRQIRREHLDNLCTVIEEHFTIALHNLLEDGLKENYTVWSMVKRCSPTLYRQHLCSMIDSNSQLVTDHDRFHAFIKELTRLGDLNAWLLQLTHGRNGASTLRHFYGLDGFLFLASSVTQNLWDDLTDTLVCLSDASDRSFSESISQSQSEKIAPSAAHSPRYQKTSLRSPNEQHASSNSVKRLASKIGRQISLLPSQCNLNGFAAKTTVSENTNNSKKPSKSEQKMSVEQLLNFQPHLQMASRWSEWTLRGATGQHGVSHEPFLGRHLSPKVVNVSDKQISSIGSKSRKSPSMIDIRCLL